MGSVKKTQKIKASRQHMREFLKQNSIGVLSTVDPNGYPDASVVYYSIDDNFNVLFVTKRLTKKHDNLTRNNQVQFLVFEPVSQTSSQIRGFATEISDADESQAAFNGMLKAAYETSESQMPPVSKLLAGPYVAYKINPTQIRMVVFARPDPKGLNMYETIDF